MASTSIEALEQDVEQVTSVYEANFAGQSRATRDLSMLEGLVKRLQAVVAQLEKARPGAGSKEATLLESARARLTMYESERGAIAEAKAAGPETVEFARLASFANFVFARYLRHFAGQARDTRDVGLLREMIDELRTTRQRMSVVLSTRPNASFQRDADLVSQVIDQYSGELREVEKAQAAGSPEERAGRLADLANAQFELYQQHFVEQSRITRRPALLQRMVENLRRVRGSMRDLRLSGSGSDNNKTNIGIVEESLRHYESELAQIRKARQGAPLSDLMGMLGGAANDVFEEYRKGFAGQDRRKVDPRALSLLCDKLGEIARQMADMGRTEPNEMNERNLEIVIERLQTYEAEWREILKAQTPQISSSK